MKSCIKTGNLIRQITKTPINDGTEAIVELLSEKLADAAVKAGAHGVISAIGGALLGAGIGYLGSEDFDAIYDNAGDIWKGTKTS
ncbi:hypothetical protein ABRT01_17920 [Lentibacillus sp. L22]|uniref:hypothetical protein n=1 Tax=Lentibacillus TaxID=175304 RepID=UPI0022B1EE45|nr:hypothetical protein [Lentibacillus daqui]